MKCFKPISTSAGRLFPLDLIGETQRPSANFGARRTRPDLLGVSCTIGNIPSGSSPSSSLLIPSYGTSRVAVIHFLDSTGSFPDSALDGSILPGNVGFGFFIADFRGRETVELSFILLSQSTRMWLTLFEFCCRCSRRLLCHFRHCDICSTHLPDPTGILGLLLFVAQIGYE